jgi:hypothetical protein
VFENKEPGKIFSLMSYEVGNEGHHRPKNLFFFTCHSVLLRQWYQGGYDGLRMTEATNIF